MNLSNNTIGPIIFRLVELMWIHFVDEVCCGPIVSLDQIILDQNHQKRFFSLVMDSFIAPQKFKVAIIINLF